LFSGVLAARLAFPVLKLHMAVGGRGMGWAGGEAYMQLVGLPSAAMPVATAWTGGCWGQNHLAILPPKVRGSPAGLHVHALMVAVIGKACHAAALAVHLCSCVVVGLDDQAYVPACECHTFSHSEPKRLSLSVFIQSSIGVLCTGSIQGAGQ
jgi:hypothetical protein